ncbi:MAG: hypothetical protein IPG01_04425 [Chitinophagaceae bacterium]|nr:hypothetical protein [Chitinophagaceae bacterium]
MKKVNFLFIATALFTMSFIFSCTKDTVESDTTAAADNAIVENESSKVVAAINAVAEDYGIGKPDGVQEVMEDSSFAPCATITVDTINALKTITIDFGPVPCQCINWDNKFRQGKITATWSGGYHMTGTVITVSTSEYFVGNSATTMNKHDYLKTIKNEGENANGNIHFSISVTDALVTLYTGETISWESNRDREWIEGSATKVFFDDVYLITGGAAGIDRKGNPFTVNIIQPLKMQFCPWLVSGIIEISHDNFPVKTLDYGNGECDDKATVTINGNSYTINL